jgi:hypothetical protein
MMKFHWITSSGLSRALVTCLLSLTMLAACAKSVVPVSLHGVNYSGETFSYVVADPNNPKNTGGGELIEPYATGGTMCCIDLPRKWHSGIKLRIESTHWLGNLANNTLREVPGTHLVDVPRYMGGEPGELWVLRAADGAISLVSSDFQPDHPKWPGKVKGWPVPSLEYQRERWDLYIKHQEDFLEAYERLLSNLDSSPEEAAREAWGTSSHYDKKALVGYSGPDDVAFRKKLKDEYETGIQEIRTEIARLQKGRP